MTGKKQNESDSALSFLQVFKVNVVVVVAITVISFSLYNQRFEN